MPDNVPRTSDQGYRIFVRPVSGLGASVQVSIDSAYTVRWSPVENRLFFSNYRIDEMYTASFSTVNDVFISELPEILFELGVSSGVTGLFDLTPDGKRFVVLAPAEKKEESDPVNPRVILNWFEELRTKAPSAKNN